MKSAIVHLKHTQCYMTITPQFCKIEKHIKYHNGLEFGETVGFIYMKMLATTALLVCIVSCMCDTEVMTCSCFYPSYMCSDSFYEIFFGTLHT